MTVWQHISRQRSIGGSIAALKASIKQQAAYQHGDGGDEQNEKQRHGIWRGYRLRWQRSAGLWRRRKQSSGGESGAY